MSLILKQSTAIDIRMGPFVDESDGKTPETGVTIAASDQAEVLKANGAATVAMTGTFAAVSGSDGWYDYTVATGDVDTVGEVVFVMQDVSVYLPVFVRGYVVEEEVYVDMFAASAVGYLKPVTAGRDIDITAGGAAGIDWGNVENPTTAVDLSATDIQLVDTATTVTNQVTADVTQLGGVTQSLTDLKDFADAGYDPATNKVQGVVLVDTTTTNTDLVAAASVADAVWDEDATAHQSGGTFGQAIGDPGANAETMYEAVVTDAAGTNVAADIIAVKTETAAILVDTTGLNGDVMRGTNNAALASVCTETRLAELDSTNMPQDIDAILADTGTDGVVISTATAEAIADVILSRDFDNAEATAAIHSLISAGLKAVAGVEDIGGILRTFRTDGTTKHMDQTITTNTANEPIDKLSVGT